MMESCEEWIYVKCVICEKEIWSYRSYTLTQWFDYLVITSHFHMLVQIHNNCSQFFSSIFGKINSETSEIFSVGDFRLKKQK